MTADSSNPTITYSVKDGDSGVNSPSGRITLPSPWAQVVREGIEPDSISQSPLSESAERNLINSDHVTAVDAPSPAETQPECSDSGNVCNAGGVTKSVWNAPATIGVVQGSTSPVIGAASWPALSESTRPRVKLLSVSSKSSSKPKMDESAAVSQAPVISQSPPKHVKPNSNAHPNRNHVRQRPMRRGGNVGGVSAVNNRPPVPPLPPPFPIFDMLGNFVPAVPEFPQPTFKNHNWSHRSIDQTPNRNPARRNNFGPRPVNIANGGRRDHHGPRSPAARDAYIPHQVGSQPPPLVRGFVRPPFIPQQPLRPYGAPMDYEIGASYVYIPTLVHELYRGGAPLLPHGASGSSMHIPYFDPSLLGSILRQIEYYFSDENLVKDIFLRSHMDDEGWVPIKLIAGFQRVQKLTNDMQMILSTLTYSNAVEIQGDKVRRRTDWRRWIHVPRETSVEDATLQKLTLEDGYTNEKKG